MRYKNIKNLSNTSWTIIDNPGVMGTGINLFKVNFVSDDTEYSSMRFEDGVDGGILFYDDTEIVRYPEGNWSDDAYQTVEIKGGADATNPMLLSWFSKYAKNYTPTAQTADIVSALKNISQAISEGGGGGSGESPIMKVDITLTPVTHTEEVEIGGETQELTVFEEYEVEWSRTQEEMQEWIDNGGLLSYRIPEFDELLYCVSNQGKGIYFLAVPGTNVYIDALGDEFYMIFDIMCDPSVGHMGYFRVGVVGISENNVFIKTADVINLTRSIYDFGDNLVIYDDSSENDLESKVVNGSSLLLSPCNPGFEAPVYYFRSNGDGTYNFYSWVAPYTLCVEQDQQISDTKYAVHFVDYNGNDLDPSDFLEHFYDQPWVASLAQDIRIPLSVLTMPYFTTLIPDISSLEPSSDQTRVSSDQTRVMLYWDENENSYVLELADIGGGGSSDSNVEWLHLPIYNYNYDSATGNYTLDDSLVVTELHIPINKDTGECIYPDWGTFLENTSDINDFSGSSGYLQYDGKSYYVYTHKAEGSPFIAMINFSNRTEPPYLVDIKHPDSEYYYSLQHFVAEVTALGWDASSALVFFPVSIE